MSGPLALGLLGAGRIGRVHARSLAVIEDARLVAVADPDEAAAATVARLTGARVASADKVLDDPAIQGVLIATPTDLHADQIERAAQAAKPIFCEKPVALALNRARRALRRRGTRAGWGCVCSSRARRARSGAPRRARARTAERQIAGTGGSFGAIALVSAGSFEIRNIRTSIRSVEATRVRIRSN